MNANTKKLNDADAVGKLLLNAIEKGSLEDIKNLLKAGADVNARYMHWQKWGPLHFAVYYGKVESAELLIEHGADVNAKDEYGMTPLFIAAQNNFAELAGLLIKHGAYVDATNIYKNTSLHFAAEYGSYEVAELLIANGADINAKDKEGWTSLHWAADHTADYSTQNMKCKVARLLVANGADPELKNNRGKKPTDFRNSEVNKAIIAEIKKIDIEKEDSIRIKKALEANKKTGYDQIDAILKKFWRK